MNNRMLGAAAAVLALALVAVGVLFYTTSQTLSETEDDLANVRRTGTIDMVTAAAQGTSTQAEADAFAATSTAIYEAQVQTREAADAAAATAQAQAEATQTALAGELDDSEAANDNLSASATRNYNTQVAGAVTAQFEAEATQTVLAGTATQRFDDQVATFDEAQARATIAGRNAQDTQTAVAMAATNSSAEQAATLEAAQSAAQAAEDAAAATQVALAGAVEDSQSANDASAATATAYFEAQSAAITAAEDDLAAQAAADAEAQQNLAGDLADASDQLDTLQADIDAQAAALDDIQQEIGNLQATIEAQGGTVPEATPRPAAGADFPSKLNSFGDGLDAVVAELEAAGAISDGETLFEITESVTIDTVETGSISFRDSEHTDAIFAANITPNYDAPYNRNQESEFCELIVRAVVEDGSYQRYIALILANDGFLVALDVSGSRDTDRQISDPQNMGIVAGESYHIIMIIQGDELTVYLDGRLVIDRFVVEQNEEGLLALGILSAANDTTCEYNDIWAYRLN